jgi:hypothetical protein
MHMFEAMSDNGPYNVENWAALMENANATGIVGVKGPDVSLPYRRAPIEGWEWRISVRDDIPLQGSNVSFDINATQYVTGTTISLSPPENLTVDSTRGPLVLADPSWRMCVLAISGLSESANAKLQGDDGSCSSALTADCITEIQGLTSAAQGVPGACRCPNFSGSCLEKSGFVEQPRCSPLLVPANSIIQERELSPEELRTPRIWERDPRDQPGPSWCEEPCFGVPTPPSQTTAAPISVHTETTPRIQYRNRRDSTTEGDQASYFYVGKRKVQRRDGEAEGEPDEESPMSDAPIQPIELSTSEMAVLGRFPVIAATDEPHEAGNRTAYDDALRKVWPMIVTWAYDGNVTGNSVLLPRSYLSCVRAKNVTKESRVPSAAAGSAPSLILVTVLGGLAAMLFVQW